LKRLLKKYNRLAYETIEQARDGIFWLDKNGNIQMANMAACDTLKYTRTELLKMNISEIDIDVPPEKYKNVWEITKTKGRYIFEARHKRKDNVVYPVEILCYYTYLNPEEEYLCAFFRNISEKKEIEANLRKTLEELSALKKKLEDENIYLREEIKLNYDFTNIIGESNGLKKVLAQVEQVADTKATVLILGETGTGKELIARAIHNYSSRKRKPFIHVNCASLPQSLIESELFGYEKGAFTGANIRKIGRFELADGGTIFLDEIAELPLELQPKLLKILQDNEFERLGSTETTKVDIRIIAATNKNLEELVAKGLFREDLFYRLNVFPIEIPPLRERKEDIPLLVKYFVEKFSKAMGKKFDRISQKSMQYLVNYPWPGNVRELKNIIERTTIISKGNKLEIDNCFLKNTSRSKNVTNLFEVEKQHIINILESTSWKVSGRGGAAELLGLKPTTLEARMKKMNIKRPKPQKG